MKILITGNKGFIGTHLHKLIPEADGLDIKNSIYEDIRTFSFEKEYTHIFHLAALRSPVEAEDIPEAYISTNCFGTVRLLKRYPKARFLNVTSASVEHVCGVYGATKKFSEMIGALHQNTVNVRPYNIFGDGQPIESNTAIPNFINCMLKGERPVLYGDGSYIRDFTYVGDLVIELKRLMFSSEVGLRLCGYAEPVMVKEILEQIYTYNNSVPDINWQPERPTDYKTSVAPYGIEQVFGRTEGLKRTIKWWKNEMR